MMKIKTLEEKIEEYENWLKQIKEVLGKTESALRCIELRAQIQILETVVYELKQYEQVWEFK